MENKDGGLVGEYGEYGEFVESIWQKDKLHFKNYGIMHAIMGIAGEGGELLDAVKRACFYGTPLDKTNIKEEIGDLMYYLVCLLRGLDITMDECIELNIKKLSHRYNGGFSTEKAVNRDLEGERKILEGAK